MSEMPQNINGLEGIWAAAGKHPAVSTQKLCAVMPQSCMRLDRNTAFRMNPDTQLCIAPDYDGPPLAALFRHRIGIIGALRFRLEEKLK